MKPARPITAPASGDQPPESPIRQRQAPIEIGGDGIVFTFRVIPELPAIARASMAVHIVADAVGPSSSDTLGFLRMSAANARAFLTNLRDESSPIVATGTRTAQCRSNLRARTPGLSVVGKPGQRNDLHRWVIDWRLDLETAADELSCRSGRLGHLRQ